MRAELGGGNFLYCHRRGHVHGDSPYVQLDSLNVQKYKSRNRVCQPWVVLQFDAEAWRADQTETFP
jgi:hypothetical protein